MGLEMVELLLDVEESFNTSLTDEEATACETPRQLIDTICSKLQIATAGTCSSQRAFYLLRRKLVERWDIPRNKIRPSALIDSVIPRSNWYCDWPMLRDAVGAKVWPDYRRFDWYGRALGAALAGTGLLFLQPFWTHKAGSYGIGAAIVCLLIVVPAGCWLVIFGKGQSPRTLHSRSAALRDLVPYAETSDQLGWTREKIAQTVKLIILEQCWVQEGKYHEDAHWADLSMA